MCLSLQPGGLLRRSVVPQPCASACPLVSMGRKPGLVAGSSDVQTRELGLQWGALKHPYLEPWCSLQYWEQSAKQFAFTFCSKFCWSQEAQTKHLFRLAALCKRHVSFSPSYFLHEALSCVHTLICCYLISLLGLGSKFTLFGTGNLCYNIMWGFLSDSLIQYRDWGSGGQCRSAERVLPAVPRLWLGVSSPCITPDAGRHLCTERWLFGSRGKSSTWIRAKGEKKRIRCSMCWHEI